MGNSANILLPLDDNGHPIHLPTPSGTTTVVDGTSGSAASGQFTTDTTVRLAMQTADGFYKIAASPTATTSDVPLADKSVEYILIPAGNKIACVTGKLHVTVCQGG